MIIPYNDDIDDNGSSSVGVLGSTAPGLARRGIIMWAFRGGAVFVVALAAYVAVEVMRRLPYFQKMRIRQRIELPEIRKMQLTAKELELDETRELWLQRPLKEVFLRSVFDSDPSGPLLLTGPDGSGKSGLLRQVLTNRRNTLYLDLREKPVLNGHELLATFVERSGYLMRPQELLGRAIFERAAGGGRAGRGEDDAEAALWMITEVLKQMRAEREQRRRKRAMAARNVERGDLGLGLLARDAAEGRGAGGRGFAAGARKWMSSARGGTSGGSGSEPSDASHSSSSSSSSRSTSWAETALLWLVRRSAGAPSRQELLFRWYAMVFGAEEASRAANRARRRAMEAIAHGGPLLPGDEEEGSSGYGSVAAYPYGPEDSLSWSDEMPVLALDELHYVNSRQAADADMRRLLDWALFLTDTRLAHVVLSCPIDLAEQLDYHPGFHVRRIRLYIDYARTTSLKEYFKGPVRRFLEARAGPWAKGIGREGASGKQSERTTGKEEGGSDRGAGEKGGVPPVSASAASHGTVSSGAMGARNALRLWREARGLSWDLDADTGGEDAAFLQSNAFRFRPLHAPPEVKTRLGIGFQGFGAGGGGAKAAAAGGESSSAGTKKEGASSGDARGSSSTRPGDASPKTVSSMLGMHGSWEPTAHPHRRALQLSDAEADSIISVVGGNMKDVDTVVQAVAGGHAWSSVVGRLVADSVELVEALLEDVLEGALAGSGGEGNASKGHGGGLAGEGHAAPSAAARSEAWLRRRHSHRTSIGTSANTASSAHDPSLRGPGGGPLSHLQFLRLFRLLEDLAARKYVSRRDLTAGPFAGCGWEMDAYVDAGVLICANLRSSVKLASTATVSPVQHNTGAGGVETTSFAPSGASTVFGIPAAVPQPAASSAGAELPASGPGRFVGAASPRLRVAFRAVVQSREAQALRARVQRDVLAGAAAERMVELEAMLAEARQEREFWLKEAREEAKDQAQEDMAREVGAALGAGGDADEDEGEGDLADAWGWGGSDALRGSRARGRARSAHDRLAECRVRVDALLREKEALRVQVWEHEHGEEGGGGEGEEEGGGGAQGGAGAVSVSSGGTGANSSFAGGIG